uniref:Protein krueppel n=1 Tax=Heliothis virescens TaxID=7102 RepID=A0A2A4JBW9_HELVI
MTSKICRVCLNREFLVNIFKKTGFLTISTKLMSIAKIQISPEDGLPDTICSKCVQKLDDCIEFIELCETSDVKLRALLESSCREKSLLLDSQKIIVENENFSDNETLSPKSEDKMLFIDESIDHSIQEEQTNLNDVDSKIEVELKIKNSPKTKMKKNRKHQCFICGKVMSSRFRLKTHMRTHTGERPYTCQHCNKNFSLAQNLKVHLRIHTGEKPLQCTICGESFAQSAGLIVHKRKHSGILPYECKLCPRSFRTNGHLLYHTRQHTGEKNFECDTCGRAFIARSDLKKHLVTHTGARPHVCCICGVRLTRATHLKRHMQLTHNKNVYSCDRCPEEFMKKSELERHSETHKD